MKTVERGAAFLDERMPGWEEKINLDRLRLQSECNCVLGQLYCAEHPRTQHTAYIRKRNELGISETEAAKFGFMTWGTGDWWNLTEAWKKVIRKRRKASA